MVGFMRSGCVADVRRRSPRCGRQREFGPDARGFAAGVTRRDVGSGSPGGSDMQAEARPPWRHRGKAARAIRLELGGGGRARTADFFFFCFFSRRAAAMGAGQQEQSQGPAHRWGRARASAPNSFEAQQAGDRGAVGLDEARGGTSRSIFLRLRRPRRDARKNQSRRDGRRFPRNASSYTLDHTQMYGSRTVNELARRDGGSRGDRRCPHGRFFPRATALFVSWRYLRGENRGMEIAIFWPGISAFAKPAVLAKF